MRNQILIGDCLEVMRAMPDDCADLCFTSPPFEDCRTYGIDFKAKGQGWVDWMIPRVVEMCRVTSGLVFINAAGKVRDFSYSPVVEWLVADLTRQHCIVCGPAPYVFHRVGIPGSGGKHYHRRDWEPIYAFALEKNLPPKWSDNTAFGKPCKWGVGGAMSNRTTDGRRRNAATGARLANGRVVDKLHTKTMANGSMKEQGYTVPDLANPGNVLKIDVGGGRMGDELAHENEAPFPEELVRRFIAWYCPEGGIVLDPFSGSGTVASVAKQEGRNFIAIDVRESQTKLIAARTKQEMLL